MTLDEYKEGIAKLYDEGADLSIGNSRPEHAAALYELFFSRAEKEVAVFCCNLASNVFDDPSVSESVQRALDRGVAVKVLKQEEDHEAQALDSWNQSDNFEVRKASDRDSSLDYNFCVVDSRAYRFERDKKRPEAFANMNSPEDAGTLEKRFREMWRETKALA